MLSHLRDLFVCEFAFALLLTSLVVQFSKGNVGEKAGDQYSMDAVSNASVSFFQMSIEI
jgi:hypothetical protein